MDEIITTPYDFVEVTIGDVKMMARPIKWNGEIVTNEGLLEDGSIAKPVECESTCPHCGQMVVFEAIYEAIECSECGVGENIFGLASSPFQDPGIYLAKVETPQAEETPQAGEEEIEAEEVPTPDKIDQSLIDAAMAEVAEGDEILGIPEDEIDAMIGEAGLPNLGK